MTTNPTPTPTTPTTPGNTPAPGNALVTPESKSMDELVALCKRRGFVYPASEIYGGLNGFWDYGPLGTALKNNIRDHWWKRMVTCPPIDPDTGDPISIVGLDSSIIQNPKTWEASGHVGGFSDPMVDDTETKQRFRADHLFGLYLFPPGSQTLIDQTVDLMERGLGVSVTFSPKFTFIASTYGEALSAIEGDSKLIKPFKFVEEFEPEPGVQRLVFEDRDQTRYTGVLSHEPITPERDMAGIPSPFTGKKGTLTPPREFNLMFDTTVGAIKSDDNKAYLRPETAQGIFLNYKNVVDTMRVKLPFGIAQVGKSFRNEVTPRNFIFRSREFEQMEMEWFCHPEDSAKWYAFWKEERMKWWESLGVSPDNLRFRDHDEDELAHYSKMCVDVEYKYPFTAPGYGELEGVAHRGCFDLSAHSKQNNKDSNADMTYFDQERQLALKAAGASPEEVKEKSRYIPHVIEPASGLTRAVLVLLCEAFTPTPDRKGSAYIMSFDPKFAPVKAGIFPLVNKDGMPEIARKLYMSLREKYPVEYDAKQSIGKRYARMDEIGTPFCIAIDGDTAEKGTVTVRDRDTTAQETINLDQVEAYLEAKLV